MNWIKYPTKFGLIVYLVLLTSITFVSLSFAKAPDQSVIDQNPASEIIVKLDKTIDELETIIKLDAAMIQLCKEAPNHPIMRMSNYRFILADYIFEASQIYSEDPFFILATLYSESSLRYKARGKKDEIGLGQQMPRGVASRGCDLSTTRGQVMCTANWLHVCRLLSGGSDAQTIVMYKYGYGVPETLARKLVRKRLEVYESIKPKD